MLSLEAALRHLGYDEVDDAIVKTVTSDLAKANRYLLGAVGDDLLDFMLDDPRIDILLEAYLDDIHDDRGTTSAKANNAKRNLVHSTEWQLRLELARKREEAASV